MSVVAPTRLVSSASIDTRLSEATLLLQEFPGSEVPSRAQACVKAKLSLPSWARGRGGPRSDRAPQGAGWSRVQPCAVATRGSALAVGRGGCSPGF